MRFPWKRQAISSSGICRQTRRLTRALPRKNLLREFKRILRPDGLLMIGDYPLQTDERNLARHAKRFI